MTKLISENGDFGPGTVPLTSESTYTYSLLHIPVVLPISNNPDLVVFLDPDGMSMGRCGPGGSSFFQSRHAPLSPQSSIASSEGGDGDSAKNNSGEE